MTRSALLHDEPWDRQKNPHTGRIGDKHTQPPIIVRLTSIHIKGEQNPHQNSQNKHLPTALPNKRHVLNLIPQHHIYKIVLLPIDLARLILQRLISKLRRISGQSGKSRRPEGNAHLIRNQAHHVETRSDGPLIGRVNAQPAEAQPKGDDRPENQDPRPPHAIIGEAADHEEEHDLDGEADAVREQDNRINRPVPAKELQPLRRASLLVQQVLKARRREVEKRQSVVTHIIGIV